jgi:hypothetical protein
MSATTDYIDGVIVSERHIFYDGDLVLYTRGDVYHYQLKFGPNSYERKSTKKRSKPDALKVAEDRYQQVQSNIRRGISNTVPLFVKVAQEFIAEISLQHTLKNKRNSSGTSINIYVIQNYLILYFGTKPINYITQNDVTGYHKWCIAKWNTDSKAVHKEVIKRAYVGDERVRTITRKRKGVLRKRPSVNSFNHHETLLNRILKFAVDKRYMTLAEMPAIIKTKKNIKRRGAFSDEQVKQLLDHLEARISTTLKRHQPARRMLWLFTRFLLLTGARVGTEVYNVKFKDFSFYPDAEPPYVVLNITQSKIKPHSTVCPWSLKAVYDELWAMFDNPTLDTNVWNGHSYNLALTKVMREIGISKDGLGNDLTPYSCRHTKISQDIKHGVPMHLIEAQYATSSTIIKKHYQHIIHLNYVAELLK